ncbi:glycosyltransferase family 39 protein [bacterium]|nr:glycosyltransferase family 39 protein [bacterium]
MIVIMANYKNKITSFVNQQKFIILILFGGAFLRFYHLGFESYWLDEGQSVDCVLNFKKYFQDYFAGDNSNHPPLYYILLYFWTYLGIHEFTTRVLSTIIGLFTILIIYQFTKKFYGKNTGLLAALFLSLSTFHLQYCQEVREYILLIPLSLLGIFSFNSYLQENRLKHLILFCIFSILGFWTHYFYAFTFVYLNLVYLFLFKKYKLRFRNWFLVQIIILITIIPILIPVFKTFLIPVAIGASTAIDWLKPPNIYSLKDVFCSDLSSTIFLLSNPNISSLFRKLAKLLFLLLFIWGFLYPIFRNSKNLTFVTNHLVLSIYILFYPLFIYLISIYFKPIFNARYLVSILPVYLIIVATGVDNLKVSFLKYMTILFIFIISLSSSYAFFTQEVFTKDQYREVALYIQENEKEGDIICINSTWPGVVFGVYYNNYYHKGNLKTKYFSDQQNHYHQLLSSLLKNHKRIWLVESNIGVYKNENINEFVENNYSKLKEVLELNLVKVNLYLYKVSG